MKIIIGLCFLVVAANAFSLDALRNLLEDELDKRAAEDKEVTLKEYLENQETPDPLYRSLARRNAVSADSADSSDSSDCANVCGAPPPADHTGQTCASNKWVPSYETKGDCECLTAYKCCTGTCPSVNLETCWNNNKKGLLYGVKEVDCCGCPVVKCVECQAPTPKETICSKAKPAKCYTYNPQAAHAADTGCWESACPENQSDAPADEVCDTDCETEQTVESDCKFPYKVCQGTKLISTCTRRTRAANKPELPLNCYNNPVSIADTQAGKYYDSGSDSCLQCQKFRYDKKSCQAQNQAVAASSCHQVGEMEYDEKCMKKTVTQDSCKCDVRVCTVAHNEKESKFGVGEVCPKGHVKMSGVSICGVARDLCFQCPPVVEEVDCPIGRVIETQDVNTCPKKVCQPPTIPDTPCESKQYSLNSNANAFVCIPA